jgi:MFS family permease
VLLAVIYLGFISLGLPDGTLGVAWPQVHRELHVPIGLAGMIMVVGTLLAAISGFSSGYVIRKFATGPVVLASCILTGTGLLIVGNAHSFTWLLLSAVPLGFGAGAVDAGLNGYVAKHYSGRQMNWLHACWGIGATCGPFVMSECISRGFGWRRGYFTLGAAQLTLAAIFLVSLRLWSLVPTSPRRTDGETDSGPAPTATANSTAGWLSAAIFAIYVAAEATTGLWAASILVVSRGLPQGGAGFCATAYYASITIGRILVGVIVDRAGNRRLVTIGGILALCAATGFAFAHSIPVAALTLTLLGLGLAPIYPCLMHEVPRRFAPESVQVVIGRQSGAANIGGAFLPAAAGTLAQVSLDGVAWLIIGGIVALLLCIRRLDRLT